MVCLLFLGLVPFLLIKEIVAKPSRQNIFKIVGVIKVLAIPKFSVALSKCR